MAVLWSSTREVECPEKCKNGLVRYYSAADISAFNSGYSWGDCEECSGRGVVEAEGLDTDTPARVQKGRFAATERIRR